MFSSFVTANQLFSLHEDSFREGQGLLSPAIWRHALGSALPADGQMAGIWCGDDFGNLGAVAGATSANTNFQGYGTYSDTSCGVRPKAAASPRAELYTTTTDNVEAWLTSNGNTGGMGAISETAGSNKFTAFETCVAVGQVSNTYGAFIGLGGAGLAANSSMDDTGATLLTTGNFLGFQVLEADGDQFEFIYQAASQTKQTVASDIITTTVTGSTAGMTAGTFYNLGLVYNPKWSEAKRLRWYINNVEQGTYITGGTNGDIQAATFPEDIYLAFVAGLKNGENVAKTMEVKFWRFFQEQ